MKAEMKRNVYKDLKEWKMERGRKPLLIRGARQVGKSYVVSVFGNNEFNNYVTINFEKDPFYKELFKSHNPEKIVEGIVLLSGQDIKNGKTLLFLDEIQECPEAIVSLRYFYEEMPELHIIGAGSLLEFALKLEGYKIPVGRIQYLYMKPLSFIEFIEAFGEIKLSDYISNKDNYKNMPQVIHEKLLEHIKRYFILGGMPEVVRKYIETGDILKCQKIQRSIIDTYEDDFSKYAGRSKIKYLKKVFNASARMVGQKFVYSNVDSSLKSRELKEAVELLETAGILTRIKRTNGDGLPLEANVKDNYFKMLFLDIGLLHNVLGSYGEVVLEKNIAAVFKGAVAEQYVGQELLALQTPFTKPNLYYWTRDAKNSNAEVDYLISLKGKIIPIEVKSGKTNKMISLRMFINKYHIEYGVKISQEMYKEVNDNVEYLPFYGLKSIFYT